MSDLFNKTNCDRCGESLQGKSRTMSMYNTQCICMNCMDKESKREDYSYAKYMVHREVVKGNYNFEGVGL